VAYSNSGNELVATYLGGQIYLFNLLDASEMGVEGSMLSPVGFFLFFVCGGEGWFSIDNSV